MYGQTASNLHAACGAEVGTCIMPGKKTIKTPQLATVTAS